jgi:hypothetical protein
MAHSGGPPSMGGARENQATPTPISQLERALARFTVPQSNNRLPRAPLVSAPLRAVILQRTDPATLNAYRLRIGSGELSVGRQVGYVVGNSSRTRWPAPTGLGTGNGAMQHGHAAGRQNALPLLPGNGAVPRGQPAGPYAGSHNPLLAGNGVVPRGQPISLYPGLYNALRHLAGT